MRTECDSGAEGDVDFVGTLTELLRSLAQALQDNEAVLGQSFGRDGMLRTLQAFQVQLAPTLRTLCWLV